MLSIYSFLNITFFLPVSENRTLSGSQIIILKIGFLDRVHTSYQMVRASPGLIFGRDQFFDLHSIQLSDFKLRIINYYF